MVPGVDPRTVALATSVDYPDLDDDGPALVAALDRRGVPTAICRWDDPEIDWQAYAAVVIRSTWDYTRRAEEFVAWARRVGTTNPPEMVAWNADKRYLADLASAGLPVVPTVYVEPGRPLPALDLTDVVIKPTISAGARDTLRFADLGDPAAQALLARIHATGRTAMVQPYLAAVDELGESALVHVDGAYSHTVRKNPLLAGGDLDGGPIPDEIIDAVTARDPSPEEQELADRVLAAIPARLGRPLYARVDLVPGDDGPVLLELELVEPSLYLQHGEGASERLAAAIAALVD